jgi:predicted DsbA family dithiol-disulfide isomerase
MCLSLRCRPFCSARLEQADPAFAGAQQRLDSLVRTAFFELNLDPSDNDTLTQLVDEAMLPVDMLLSYMRSGEAHARLATGLQEAAAAAVRSSPTLTFNEGRQMLSGNVGYRILEANIQELLRHPGDQQSWC